MFLRKHLNPALLGARLVLSGVALTFLATATACTYEVRDDDDDDDDDDNTSTSSSQTGPGPSGGTCSGDAMVCADTASLNVCEEGTFQSYSCHDICSAHGFTSNGCAESTCKCGEPTDQTCALGVAAACTCLEAFGEGACSEDEFWGSYESCYQGTDGGFFNCNAQYVVGDEVDCWAMVENCA